jgi:hypothetical protein
MKPYLNIDPGDSLETKTGPTTVSDELDDEVSSNSHDRQKHAPLRPATSIDVELARPHPEELTEIEEEKDQIESVLDEKSEDERDQAETEVVRQRSDRSPI